MAGDWIKMRANLWDDPRVSRLCEMVGAKEATIVGGLYWLWASADQHSTDGLMHGLSPATVDRKTGIKGFGKALVAIGWLTEEPDGLRIARFDEHNGESAKTRAEGSKRKASWRARTGTSTGNPQDGSPGDGGTDVPQNAGQSRDKPEAREEKRREEVLDTPPQEGRGERLDARASRLPPHWRPSETLTAWAKSARPDIQGDDLLRLTQDFRDHYRSTGARREDWDAAWQKWVRGQRAKQPAAATAQAPNAASHSVEKAREVIEETRAAARTAVPMPKAIRDLLPKLPAGDQEAA